jgi:hypothetical protein
MVLIFYPFTQIFIIGHKGTIFFPEKSKNGYNDKKKINSNNKFIFVINNPQGTHL